MFEVLRPQIIRNLGAIMQHVWMILITPCRCHRTGGVLQCSFELGLAEPEAT